MIPGIFFLIIVVILICVASRGIPIGTLIIFGLLYFQAIIVSLVVQDKFSIEGILGMPDVFNGIFINPLVYFDSALAVNAGVAILELSIFAGVLIYISYKVIYNNLKNTIKKKRAFLYGMIVFGILFIGVFGGGMPGLWTIIYLSLLENLLFVIITLIIIGVLLFVFFGTNWLKRTPAEPAAPRISDTLQEINREFDKLEKQHHIRRFEEYA